MGLRQIVFDVLADMRNGVSVRECAMRYDLSERTVCRYRAGMDTTGLRGRGRPRALTKEQEDVVAEVFARDEATVSELACIYQVSVGTIRNVLKRQRVW